MPEPEPAPAVADAPLAAPGLPPVRPPAARPAPPPLVPVDRKTGRALARGRRVPDSTVDLHGHTQARAHAVLFRFLADAQRRGDALVLVVTGKGRPGDDGLDGGRGILRRTVPLWLALPELRPVVLGWGEAAPHQGGAGALYVRLRRRRG